MTAPLRIALATAAEVPDLDADDGLLRDALEAAGAATGPAVWDDPAVSWSEFDAVVVRSTWDYAPRRPDFLAWAERVADDSLLLNRVDLLRWSSDKHYLADLESAGLPIVPTTFLEPGQRPEPDLVTGAHVVKPAVSAGSRDTFRLGSEEGARALRHVADIHDSGRTAMVQPYLSGVDELGETELIYVDGTFSHAVRKGPILREGAGQVEGLFAPEDISPRDPSEAERALGDQVMAAVPGEDPPLYARVDLLPGASGPVVLELELVEPSLFLGHADGAPQRLAASILTRTRGHLKA